MDISKKSLGNITKEDVLAALGDTDPHATNSGKLREKIGRGSGATVQKHLDAIREERKAARVVETVGEMPSAPKDAVEVIWRAAWTAAHTSLLNKLERLTAEKDTLAAHLATSSADVTSLTDQLSDAEAVATAAEEANSEAQAKAAFLADHSRLTEEKLADAQAKASQDLNALMQKMEIAEKDAEIKIQTLSAVIDRASQRESDLRTQLQDAQKRADELVTKLAAIASTHKVTK
jgi:chromosome segregation ATPase